MPNKHLNLSHQKNLTTQQLTALANDPELDSLNLEACNISDADVEIIATSKTITNLNLANNKISSDSIISLIWNKTVIQLNLFGNNLGNDVCYDLVLHNASITSINLGKNMITDNGVKALMERNIITDLNLGFNIISDIGVKALASDKTLTNLNLEHNSIDSCISIAGIAAFVNSNNLKHLNLNGNGAYSHIISYCNLDKNILLKILKANPYLTIFTESRYFLTLGYDSSFYKDIDYKVIAIDEQHQQNFKDLISLLKQFGSFMQQNTAIKAIITSSQPLHNLLQNKEFVSHQLKINPELIEISAIDNSVNRIFSNIEYYKNAYYFKLKGISSMREASLEHSLFKYLPMDIMREVNKYLSLETQNLTIQLLVPHLEHTADIAILGDAVANNLDNIDLH